jgi:hypothetical protein
VAYFHWDDDEFWELGDEIDQYRKIIIERAPGPQLGMREACFNLGDPDDPATPHISILLWKPGNKIFRHAHPAHRFELLVRGTLDTPAGALTAGAVMFTGPNEPYGPLIAGPDGALTVEVIARLGDIYMDFTDEHTDPELVEWITSLMSAADLDPELRHAVQVTASRGNLAGS